ncbi:CRISPR-associated helicase Cas3' [Verrucomicrobiaceae bacterium R5-34]|nr:CRISPR-associated helicase Cas3' [Verrucomicrobiaceae bacterium R5-34]
MSNRTPFIAHVRETDGLLQSLEDHLSETAEWCAYFTSALNLPQCGKLIGLLHDVGKYSNRFQKYIREITGIESEQTKIEAQKDIGKIDHATSGAQIIWDAFEAKRIPKILAQVLSVVIMSHHSRTGMKDYVDLSGTSPFLKRLSTPDSKTHKTEAWEKADPVIKAKIEDILYSDSLVTEFRTIISRIQENTKESGTLHNTFSLLCRFLFSCLLDADRINTSDFENPNKGTLRTLRQSPDWNSLLAKLEEKLVKFDNVCEINQLRAQISNDCKSAATQAENLLTLQVPTGGGKTLASLRFALHRAASPETHRVDRIIYIIPYTSIIEQNAKVACDIFGDDNILEHHSNLTEERDSWRNRVLSENWDAPIVFTTSVQFLNALFAGGTKTARRMHQLSNSILIFDEIQSLPIKSVHLFNNALNFLCQQCNTTAVLCTATMPLLNRVNQQLGALSLGAENSIIRDKSKIFRELKRTTIIDNCRPGGWTYLAASEFARGLVDKHGSLLMVCNTKAAAQHLFDILKNSDDHVIHLSTNMCPAHRRHKIDNIHKSLSNNSSTPLICISTQLIEAGVDLDFGCVIRSLAGLDSIVQAAGRCNRHGKREMGYVHVLNLSEEKIYAALKEIKEGQEITMDRIFHEFKNNPAGFDDDLLSEKAMNRYYEYFFYQRARDMRYPCKAGTGHPPLPQDATILSLLGTNDESTSEASRIKNDDALKLKFRHAFSTAASVFQVIDAPTRGIIVPYDADGHEGSKVIGELAACYSNDEISLCEQIRRHKRAQQYTVNAFPHTIDKLLKEDALVEIQPGESIYFLRDQYYHDDLGVTLEAFSELNYLQAEP